MHKKVFILIFLFVLSLTSHAQYYDPTIPSQRIPYAKQNLAEIIANIKSYLPVQLDQITYMTDIYVAQKTGSIVYKYVIDDSNCSMDGMNITDLRTSILTNIENDETNANLYWDAVVLRKSIVYMYVGQTSKKQKTVTIKYNEIRYMRHLADWLGEEFSNTDDEDLRTPKADGYEDYVEPVVEVFTLLYATSSDGVVNVRSTPNAKGTKVGEIHDLSGGYGDGVFLKPGSWYKVIASNGKVGYANSKILGKQTWYNGGKKALVAKAGCPVYSENYADGGIESGTPICRLSEGTIIADDYLEDEEGFLYILTTAHDNLYVPKRFCVLKNVY